MNPKTGDIVKSKEIESDFEPNTKVLSRILKAIAKDSSKGKTILTYDANQNYTRLVKHIVWLEKKGFVESIIINSKIDVGLTEKGTVFVSTL